jgi:hypothetical protein
MIHMLARSLFGFAVLYRITNQTLQTGEARRPDRKGFRPVAEFSDRSGDKARIVSMRQT